MKNIFGTDVKIMVEYSQPFFFNQPRGWQVSGVRISDDMRTPWAENFDSLQAAVEYRDLCFKTKVQQARQMNKT